MIKRSYNGDFVRIGFDSAKIPLAILVQMLAFLEKYVIMVLVNVEASEVVKKQVFGNLRVECRTSNSSVYAFT